HFIYHSLRWLYLWQLKEYRLDRLLSFFRLPVSGKIFILDNFRSLSFRRPRFTLKIILAFSLLFTLLYFSWLTNRLIFLVVADLLLPLLVAIIFLGLFIPSTLIHRLLILKAGIKLRQFPQLIVIGVTGSFAKTSVKDAIAAVLSIKYQVLKTPATHNTVVSIAQLIIRQLKPHHQVLVVEMGAYTRGEINQICRLVNPQIGVLTGVNEQHLDLFGSLANTTTAKYELIDNLPQTGLAIFNLDNPITKKLYQQTSKPKLGYHGSSHQPALLVAQHLHIPRATALKALKESPSTRLKKIAFSGMTLIDDSYSSNPDGFKLALQELSKFPGNKLIITPGIIELGSASHRIHRQLGQLMSQLDATVILTNPDFESDLKSSLKKLLVLENPRQVIDFLKSHQTDFQVILLEGRLPESIIKYFKLRT
ncbi:MAG: hypothetical protein HY381_02825, partial [Candidatus Chisholmbacteria bacterium]|nr:hypothetical protein [Candidatus Chisholmbacteria bacterium]